MTNGRMRMAERSDVELLRKYAEAVLHAEFVRDADCVLAEIVGEERKRDDLRAELLRRMAAAREE